MKLIEVFNMAPILQKMVAKNFPIKTAYKLTKIIKFVNEECEFYRERITSIIETYGLKDEDGQYKLSEDKQSILLNKDQTDKWNKELSELDNIEVEWTAPRLNLEELADINVSLTDMNLLFPIIDE